MKATEIVRAIMELQGVTLSTLSTRTNKTARLIADRLSQENISVDKLNEMLRVLDYKIIIVPKDTRLPEDGYEAK